MLRCRVFVADIDSPMTLSEPSGTVARSGCVEPAVELLAAGGPRPLRTVREREEAPGRRLKRWKRWHNTTHTKIRRVGEQATAALESRRLLRKPRRGTNRITDIVKVVLVLHHASA